MTKLKLLGAAFTRTFRCMWMLEELGMEYEHIPAMPMGRLARKYHKTGKVPVLLEYESTDTEKNPSFVLF